MKIQMFFTLNRYLGLSFFLFFMANLVSCTSVMTVSEIDALSTDNNKTNGIVLNKRTHYTVSVVPEINSIFCEPVDQKIDDENSIKTCKSDEEEVKNAVSMDKMLSVNAKRLPFASSTLTVDASTNYTAKKLGISDVSSGTTRAVDAATKIIDTKTNRLKLRLDAQEAESERQTSE